MGPSALLVAHLVSSYRQRSAHQRVDPPESLRGVLMLTAITGTLPLKQRTAYLIQSYWIAAAIVALAAGVRLLVDPALRDREPFATSSQR